MADQYYRQFRRSIGLEPDIEMIPVQPGNYNGPLPEASPNYISDDLKQLPLTQRLFPNLYQRKPNNFHPDGPIDYGNQKDNITNIANYLKHGSFNDRLDENYQDPIEDRRGESPGLTDILSMAWNQSIPRRWSAPMLTNTPGEGLSAKAGYNDIESQERPRHWWGLFNE